MSLLASVLVAPLVLAAGSEGSDPELLRTYREAAERAGRDAEGHVRLALWCEAHGLDSERARHLALAVVSDPAHAAARGLMGLVQEGGKWRKPGEVAAGLASDPERSASLEEYRTRRAETRETADALWKLALWCESKGLRPEAQAHLSAVVRLDPSREEAWTHLGYRKHRGEWQTAEQIAARIQDAEAQRKADARWMPTLGRLGRELRDELKRDAAEAALGEVSDPRALPSIVKVFGKADPPLAARLLAQVDSPEATRSLAMLAVFSPDEDARRIAVETLRHRDPREYADRLIGLLREPTRYHVKPVEGSDSPGELIVEGEWFDTKRLYETIAPPGADSRDQVVGSDSDGEPIAIRGLGSFSTGWVQGWQLAGLVPVGVGDSRLTFGHYSGPEALAMIRPSSSVNLTVVRHARVSARDVEDSAAVAQCRMERDIRTIEAHNAPIHALNARVLPVLRDATGAAAEPSRRAWENWYVDQLGYAQRRGPEYKPVVVELVPSSYVPPNSMNTPVQAQRISCFGAGTLVWTQAGLRPIEAIEAGDRVLSQDTTTGALSYDPVMLTHHNPPAETLKVVMDGGAAVVASRFHRFWVAGEGWRMARDLRAGDRLRTLEGVAPVAEVTRGEVQPVFNLEVAGGHSFFVGDRGALVHDNSVPGTRIRPFDAAPAMEGEIAE